MKTGNSEESRIIVAQWKSAARELERVREEELRNVVYDWRTFDAMLEFGLAHAQPRESSGIVEMQRFFMKAAKMSGLLSENAYPEHQSQRLHVAEGGDV
jgi:hypothetical protein